jgi:hypothetical protein
VLQNFPPVDSLQNLIQADVLFDHLLLCVLRDPEVSACRLQLDAGEQGFQFNGVRLRHPRVRLARITARHQQPASEERRREEAGERMLSIVRSRLLQPGVSLAAQAEIAVVLYTPIGLV